MHSDTELQPDRGDYDHAGSAHHGWLLVGILIIATVNFSAAIGWGLPAATRPENASPWPVDVIAPLPPLKEAYYRFQRPPEDPVVYPLFHYVVLAGAYTPFVATAYLTGGLQNPSAEFPYGVTDPPPFFKRLTLVARSVSLLMALTIVWLIYATTRRLYSSSAGLLAATMAAVMAPLAFYASTSNLDVPYLFWVLLGAWFLLNAIDRERLRDYAALGACAGLAAATKDQGLAFFLLPGAYLIWIAFQRHARAAAWYRALAATLADARLLLGLVTAILVYALGNNLFLGGWEGWLRHLDFERALLEAQNVTGGGQPVHTTRFMTFSFVYRLAEMIGPLFTALGIGGLVLAVIDRRPARIAVLLLAASYYFFFLEVVDVTYTRHLMSLALLLTVFGAALAVWAIRRGGIWKLTGSTLATAAVLWSAVLSYDLNRSLIFDSRYKMADWIQDNVPAGSNIESQVQVRYLPRLGADHEYEVVGNSFDAINYELLSDALTPDSLKQRAPEFILVMRNVGLSGDPDTVTDAGVKTYFEQLLSGRLGYQEIARFTTPTWLPYRQITAGTRPVTILLATGTDTDEPEAVETGVAAVN